MAKKCVKLVLYAGHRSDAVELFLLFVFLSVAQTLRVMKVQILYTTSSVFFSDFV